MSVLSHNPLHPYRYKCSNAVIISNSRSAETASNRGNVTMTAANQSFQCPLCPRAFSSMASLRAHKTWHSRRRGNRKRKRSAETSALTIDHQKGTDESVSVSIVPKRRKRRRSNRRRLQSAKNSSVPTTVTAASENWICADCPWNNTISIFGDKCARCLNAITSTDDAAITNGGSHSINTTVPMVNPTVNPMVNPIDDTSTVQCAVRFTECCNEDKWDEDEYEECLLSETEIQNISLNDKIDHRDRRGRFLPAIVLSLNGEDICIHYEGYSARFDETVSRLNSGRHFAKYKSISNRPNTLIPSLKIGDAVNIKIGIGDEEWTRCSVIKFDEHRDNGRSGQMMVCNDGYKHWHHPDDVSSVKRVTESAPISQPTFGPKTEVQEQRLQPINSYSSMVKCQQDLVAVKLEEKGDGESDVYDWTVENVMDWFGSIGFADHIQRWRETFVSQHVDGKTLLKLKHLTLQILGFKRMFDRMVVLEKIEMLK